MNFPRDTYRSSGQPAAGSITLNTMPPTGATFTVDGATYTLGTHWFEGKTLADAAISIAAAINGDPTAFLTTQPTTIIRSTYAVTWGNKVYVVATQPGTGGNSITLSVSGAWATASGATLSGGTSPSASSSVAVTDVEDGAGDSIMDAANDAMRVNVVAGSTAGTQYTEADTDASITGTAAMWEDASDTLRAISMAKPLPVQPGTSITFPISAASLPLPTGASTSAKQDTIIGHLDGVEGLLTTIDTDTGTLAGAVSGTEMQVDIVTMPAVDTELTTADLDTGAGTDTRAVVGLVGSAPGGGQLIPGTSAEGLLVNLGSNNDVTVTGSVTANAGTNLNTSALALESGGNLANAATSLAVIDDWDETDRAKVNPIVGQAGVQGGAGTVSANTQRVTLASDQTTLTNLLARVAATLETSAIYNGTTALTPKFAVVAASSSGDNEIVASVASKKIRVLSYVITSNGTVNAKWQSSTAGDLTGLSYLVANTGVSCAFSPVGHFETTAGEALQLNLSAAVAVGGHITYVEV